MLRKLMAMLSAAFEQDGPAILKDARDMSKGIMLAGILKSVFDQTPAGYWVTCMGLICWIFMIVLCTTRS